jgi:diketogulonate reductase-like aldo/keto reductase
MLLDFLEELKSQTTELQFKEVLKIATQDLMFNQVKFNKKTSERKVIQVCMESLILVQRGVSL